jgi:hypothetical protein
MWAGLVARVGNAKNAYRILIGNPRWQGDAFGGPRPGWKNNIKCFFDKAVKM